jgi:two-component system chemotaxis response regulator CheB
MAKFENIQMLMNRSASGKIRVLITDDSAVARSLLRAIFDSDGEFEVIGEAENGLEAVTLTENLHPDLVTMDLEMPFMNGAEAIEEIMSRRATPILVVSNVVTAQSAYAAVALGAVDVAQKPSTEGKEISDFLDKAKLVSTIPAITRRRPPTLSKHLTEIVPVSQETTKFTATHQSKKTPIFAIACSTGGPQALAHILGRLSSPFSGSVLIAQHIADGFAAGMAEWLASLTNLPVQLACAGELVKEGTIYLSPSERHLVVLPDQHLAFIERQNQDIYHPSCDILLTSVASVFGRRSVGIILSGMGHDGVQGVEKIFTMGGVTIAQDENSSVIFGMNRVAIERKVIHRVLNLDGIPDAMIGLGREDQNESNDFFHLPRT